MSEMNAVARFFINRSNVRRSRRLLETLRDGFVPPPSARILELGAGRGGLSALLLERYRPGRLVVTDFDPRQVNAARTYLTERFGRLPPAVELEPADARALPFDDRSFDCVFAILMLHHVESRPSEYRQRPGALREIRRVLVDGGTLVYSDFSRTEEVRRTLESLGFERVFERRRWPHRELAVFRSPRPG